MAKKKDGETNSYTPIKNPELLTGERETRTIQEIAAAPKLEAKKDNEKWVDNVERNKQKQAFSERLKERIGKSDQEMDKTKDEPEKDK